MLDKDHSDNYISIDVEKYDDEELCVLAQGVNIQYELLLGKKESHL